jgi:hypothetical protein
LNEEGGARQRWKVVEKMLKNAEKMAKEKKRKCLSNAR